MLLAGGIRTISIRYDYWKVVVIGMVSLGVFFLGFTLNSTIVWAIAVLIIVSILEKAMEPAKSMLTPRLAKAEGKDVAETGNILCIIEQFASSTKEIILSFFFTKQRKKLTPRFPTNRYAFKRALLYLTKLTIFFFNLNTFLFQYVSFKSAA